MLILNKSEQLLLLKAFKCDFKLTKLSQNLILDSSDFYNAMGKLSKAGLIKAYSKSNCKREKEYILTDLGIVLASNLSQSNDPAIGYSLIVGIL